MASFATTEAAATAAAAEGEAKTEAKAAETTAEATAEGAGGAAGGGAAPEEESTAEFNPVVTLEEVEVRTMEEDEDILFENSGKLYVYGENMLDKGTGVKQWNKRGEGNMKILKSREHDKIRVLMRQDKTKKIVANHVVDPRIQMCIKEGSETAWVWGAMDFAEGTLEERVFCLKFQTTEVAQEFKAKFEDAKAHMERIESGADAATTETATATEGAEGKDAAAATTTEDAALDEAAAALDSLTVAGGESAPEGDTAAAATDSTS